MAAEPGCPRSTATELLEFHAAVYRRWYVERGKRMQWCDLLNNSKNEVANNEDGDMHENAVDNVITLDGYDGMGPNTLPYNPSDVGAALKEGVSRLLRIDASAFLLEVAGHTIGPEEVLRDVGLSGGRRRVGLVLRLLGGAPPSLLRKPPATRTC